MASISAAFGGSPAKNDSRRLLFLLAGLDSSDNSDRAQYAARDMLARIGNRHQARQALQEILRGEATGQRERSQQPQAASALWSSRPPHRPTALALDESHLHANHNRHIPQLPPGLDTCGKLGARGRLQLALDPLVERLDRQQLFSVVPSIIKQALHCLSTHCRHDAGAAQALAALLGGIAERLVEEEGGDTATAPDVATSSGQWLFEELLLPLIRSSYRDPEARRVAAGCQALVAVVTAMAPSSHTPRVAVALRAGLAAALEHMWCGSTAKRVSAAYAPFQHWVAAVGGARLGAEGARRLAAICCRGVADKEAWQVRIMAPCVRGRFAACVLTCNNLPSSRC